MTHMRQVLVEQNIYIFSSFYQNFRSSRPELYNMHDYGKLRFVFGHNLTDAMYKLLHSPETILFTGIRDPRDAIKSDFLHHLKISKNFGGEAPSIDKYLKLHSNFMTNQILSNFSSLVDPSITDRSLQAFSILQAFDHIYESERFAQTTAPLVKYLDAGSSVSVHDNVKDQSLLDDADVQEALETLDNSLETATQDDLKLYQLFLEHRRIDNRGLCVVHPSGNTKKQKMLDSLPNREQCYQKTKEILMNGLIYEAHLIDKANEVREILKSRLSNDTELLLKLC